ncbi:hypothetical protein Pmani_020591 [Petrolisthes manimaculis]|uniref:Uncharacterized protein n=1 Tax=Petrolisthes manimaculis TaxID=1843537 RepID=A0AAE1U2F5_9EUCA|nr:hypothetical protein Pmani_020591 [Petrolisthes manimaculis]
MLRQDMMVPNATKSIGALGVTTIVFGAISMLIFGTAIGVTLGYGYFFGRTLYASCVLIPANIGLLYVTSRIIFLITAEDVIIVSTDNELRLNNISKKRNSKLASTFPDAAGLQDLHQNVARLLAFTILTFSVWVTSIVWFVMYNHYDSYYYSYIALFGCSFSYIFGIIMTGLSGGLIMQNRTRTTLAPSETHPLQQVVSRPMQAGHPNPGYAHPPGPIPAYSTSYPERIAPHRY